MQGTQRRSFRIVNWILLACGIGMLIFAAIFTTRFYGYGMSFSLILISTSHLVRPTRPWLANVCAVLGIVAALGYTVLLIISITG